MKTLSSSPADEGERKSLALKFQEYEHVVALTGAGISTNCGIPDFRELYREDGTRDLLHTKVLSTPDLLPRFCKLVGRIWQAAHEASGPSRTHGFLRALSDGGKLQRWYTQNVDGLEGAVGLCLDLHCGRGEEQRDTPCSVQRPHRACEVVQLHGSITHVKCKFCEYRTEWTQNVNSSYLEGVAPTCRPWQQERGHRQRMVATPAHLMRPDFLFYGENSPENQAISHFLQMDEKPDLLLIMGTSLHIEQVCSLVERWRKARTPGSTPVIFVNNEPPPSWMTEHIDFHFQMDCDRWSEETALWMSLGEHMGRGVEPRIMPQPEMEGKADAMSPRPILPTPGRLPRAGEEYASSQMRKILKLVEQAVDALMSGAVLARLSAKTDWCGDLALLRSSLWGPASDELPFAHAYGGSSGRARFALCAFLATAIQQFVFENFGDVLASRAGSGDLDGPGVVDQLAQDYALPRILASIGPLLQTRSSCSRSTKRAGKAGEALITAVTTALQFRWGVHQMELQGYRFSFYVPTCGQELDVALMCPYGSSGPVEICYFPGLYCSTPDGKVVLARAMVL